MLLEEQEQESKYQSVEEESEPGWAPVPLGWDDCGGEFVCDGGGQDNKEGGANECGEVFVIHS